MIQVKICGLSTPATLDAALDGGASHVGFVFFAPSPRHLDADRLAGLAASVPAHVARVGVFVDPDDDAARARDRAARSTRIQLHRTAPARAAAIRAASGARPGRRSRSRRAPTSTPRAPTSAPPTASSTTPRRPTARRCPAAWACASTGALLDGFRHPLPWALSGGLDPANVAEAIRRTGAPLVDVSSGVESAPGVKDVDKIAAFLKSAAQL